MQRNCQFIDIPYLPYQVDTDDVAENNGRLMLLPEKQIRKIKERLDKDTERASWRYRKDDLKKLGLPARFSIIKLNGKYYALYMGYKRRKALGVGTFGAVKLVQDLATGEWAAIKIQSELGAKGRHRAKEEVKNRGEQEFAMLAKAGQAQGAFESISPEKKYQYSIVTKLAAGTELFVFCSNLAKSRRDLPTVTWLQIAASLCTNVIKLHEHQLVHCDIKGENFIYDQAKGQTSIVDFGYARPVIDDCEDKREHSLVGTTGFIAPEIYERGAYSRKSDTYALGVSLLELLGLGYIDHMSRLVIHDENHPVFMNNKVIRDETARRQISRFIRLHMLARDPEARPDARETRRFITTIRERYLSLPSRVVAVGFLSVAEYSKLKTKTAKDELISGMKKFDRVILADNKQRDIKKYILLSRSLAEQGINVENRVVSAGSVREAIAAAPEWVESRDSQNIYCYFHVTNKSYKKNLTAERVFTISPHATDKVITEYFQERWILPAQYLTLKMNLQNEIKLLSARANAVSQAHAGMLADTLREFNELYAGGALTYQHACTRLVELQSQVPINRTAGCFFAKRGSSQPRAIVPDIDRRWRP